MNFSVQLERPARRLIVEAGLAAANHGMRQEMAAIQGALDDLINCAHTRRIIGATMLIGTGQTSMALHLLLGDSSPEAQLLRALVNSQNYPKA